MQPSTKRVIKITVIGAVILAAVVTLFTFNPETVSFYPKCPSKMFTGYECPGCGSLRGMHALLHGDFAAAWHFNPALLFGLFFIGLILFASIHRNSFLSPRMPRGINIASQKTALVTDHPAFAFSIFLLVIFWTIFRNIKF